MPVRLSGSGRHVAGRQERGLTGPSLDRFGACVSVVVLMATAAAVFVVRQNVDHHLFHPASGKTTAATTGAAVAK